MDCGDMVLIRRNVRSCTFYVRLMISVLLFTQQTSDRLHELKLELDSETQRQIFVCLVANLDLVNY